MRANWTGAYRKRLLLVDCGQGRGPIDASRRPCSRWCPGQTRLYESLIRYQLPLDQILRHPRAHDHPSCQPLSLGFPRLEVVNLSDHRLRRHNSRQAPAVLQNYERNESLRALVGLPFRLKIPHNCFGRILVRSLLLCPFLSLFSSALLSRVGMG